MLRWKKDIEMYGNPKHSANDRKILRLRDEVKEVEKEMKKRSLEIKRLQKLQNEDDERLRILKQTLFRTELS